MVFHQQAKSAIQEVKDHLQSWQLLKRFRVWRLERYFNTTFRKQVQFVDAPKIDSENSKSTSTQNPLSLLFVLKTEQTTNKAIVTKIEKLSEKLKQKPKLQKNPAMFFKAESLRRRAEAEGVAFQPPEIRI